MNQYDLRTTMYDPRALNQTPFDLDAFMQRAKMMTAGRPSSQSPLQQAGPAQPSMNLQSLYSSIMNSPSQQKATTVNKQVASPELEASMKNFNDMLNSLAQGTQSAYQNKAGTYGDLMTALTNMYGKAGSEASAAASASALASGLTPLEAQGQGQEALMNALQQYFPALAETKTQQADVGIQAQSALAGLQQSLGLPFLQQVQAPYLQGVAGQSQTQTQDNPMAKLGLLAQLAQSQQSDEIQRLQLAQQAQQFRESMGQRSKEFGATQGLQREQMSMEQQKLAQELGQRNYELTANIGAQKSMAQQAQEAASRLQQMQESGAMQRLLAQFGGQAGLEQFRNQLDIGKVKQLMDLRTSSIAPFTQSVVSEFEKMYPNL